MTNIIVDSKKETIEFCGHTYSQWGHIRWLRKRLNDLEYLAERMWGSEAEAAWASDEVQETKTERKFTVINGGKPSNHGE